MSLRKLLPALMCISFAGAALADNTAAPLASGIDGSAMDRNVRPQDDLFRFVNGTWLTNTPFPAEYASAGIGIMLFEKAQADVQAILLEAAAAGDKATPEMQRLGAMYGSFMDEKKVEERGIEPLKPLFAEIAAIDGPTALAQLLRPRRRAAASACRSACTSIRTRAIPRTTSRTSTRTASACRTATTS